MESYNLTIATVRRTGKTEMTTLDAAARHPHQAAAIWVRRPVLVAAVTGQGRTCGAC
jgi:hypothetical protein